MRVTQRLLRVDQAYSTWCMLWTDIKLALQNGTELEVEIRKPKRSNPQNRRMWAMLEEVASQVNWHGQKLSAEDWKHVFSSSLKKQRAVPGLDGGFVVLGTRTSEMTIEEMSEMMEVISAFGSVHDVEFSDAESVC